MHFVDQKLVHIYLSHTCKKTKFYLKRSDSFQYTYSVKTQLLSNYSYDTVLVTTVLEIKNFQVYN